MITLRTLPLWITNEYIYSIRIRSIVDRRTRMSNVQDLLVFVQSINSKKLFQLIKNNMWVGVFDLSNNFVILLAYVDLIKSKFSGQPENQVVYMVWEYYLRTESAFKKYKHDTNCKKIKNQ